MDRSVIACNSLLAEDSLKKFHSIEYLLVSHKLRNCTVERDGSKLLDGLKNKPECRMCIYSEYRIEGPIEKRVTKSVEQEAWEREAHWNGIEIEDPLAWN